jgi:hypothetical protein
LSLSFTEWLLTEPRDPDREALVSGYVDTLLDLILEEDKGVQKSALSNFQMFL